MIQQIIIASILTEALVKYSCNPGKDKRINLKCALSIIFGVAFSVFYNLDLISAICLETNVPIVGTALTGVIISRGSNYIFDLMKKLRQKS